MWLLTKVKITVRANRCIIIMLLQSKSIWGLKKIKELHAVAVAKKLIHGARL